MGIPSLYRSLKSLLRRERLSLSAFIAGNLSSILSEWDAFAGRLPGADRLDQTALRGHGEAILRAIVESMAAEAADQGSAAPEHGRGSERGQSERSAAIAAAAHAHSAERLAQGFTLDQMISEYRELRTGVVRTWGQEYGVNSEALAQLTRFHFVVDEISTEAIKWFYTRVEGARDLLVSVLAHDVRVPLGAILASAELLLDGDGLEEPHRAAAVRIRDSALRLRNLANDLLDFSRTRLGAALPYNPADTDLGEVSVQTANELRGLYPAAVIHLTCTGDLTGRFDPARIQQMLSNLIGNAIEHGGEDHPITVTVNGERGPNVIIAIQNQGPAVPVEVQQVMFDPLRHFPSLRAEQIRRTRGLGLGLFISRQIAEAQGGKIELVSRKDLGTTVTVYLPRQPSAEDLHAPAYDASVPD